MTDDQIRQEILDLLTEDYYGLWELAGLPAAPPVEELMRVLDGLVRDGLVQVILESKISSEQRSLTEGEARRAIQKHGYWEWSAPENGDHIRAAASPLGVDWYRKHNSSASMPGRRL